MTSRTLAGPRWLTRVLAVGRAHLVFVGRDFVGGRLQPDLNEGALLVGLRLELAGHALGLLDGDLGAIDGLALRIDDGALNHALRGRRQREQEDDHAGQRDLSNQPARKLADHCEPPEDYWNSCARNSLHEISGQESRDAIEVVNDRRRGQRRQKPPAVALGPEPGIEDGQDAPIAAVADQAAEALPQRQNRQRHLVLVERLAAAGADGLDARGHHRIAGRRKRQLVDDHAAQRFADDVHALPEARRGEQDRVRRLAEPFQQQRARDACPARRSDSRAPFPPCACTARSVA